MIDELADLREVVTKMADREWIIAPWLDPQRDFCWRVNVRDEPSKHKTSQTYSATEYYGPTAVAAGLAALRDARKVRA